MSQAIHAILRASSTVTTGLFEGADSIMHLMEAQSKGNPYICIDSDGDGIGTFNDSIPTEVINVSIKIFSDWQYTNGVNIGAWNKGQDVKTVLESTKGTFAGENVAKINYEGYNVQIFPNAGRDKVVLEQEYQMFINR